MLNNHQAHFIHADLILAHLVSHLPGYLYWKDQRNAYLGCNDNHAMRLGLNSGLDTLGKTDFELLHAVYSFSQYDDLVITEGRRRIIVDEFSIGGKRITALSIKSPIIAKTGEILGMINCSVDQTKEKFLEEKVQKMHKERIKPLESLRILIAERNEVTNSLHYFFTQAGCIVDVVDDIETLLKLTKTTPYGIIFMDVHLTDAKGVKLSNRIRLQLGENQSTPIVGFNACI